MNLITKLTLVFLLALFSSCDGKTRYSWGVSASSETEDEASASSESTGTPVVAPLPIDGLFIPTGFMGATDSLELQYEDDPQLGSVQKWIYRPDVGEGEWSAVAYQHPNNNWGQQRGLDLSAEGYTHLTLLARGTRGGERLRLGSGGMTSQSARYPASYERVGPTMSLTTEWQRYDLPLGIGSQKASLTNVSSAFSFTISKQLTSGESVFYLAGIELVVRP